LDRARGDVHKVKWYRRAVRLTAFVSAVGLLCGARSALAAEFSPTFSPTFSWAPADSPAVIRGREVANRFQQESLFEISVEVHNAFALDNRRAIAVAEEELRRVPGL